uniref:Kinesin-like protein n=1 Tax=Aceria tosichella TaxID=561515 RepID=A0A6G1S6W1_9ACAR
MAVRLEPGLRVDIQRTNGVIHSASITEIDWQGQSVTVEWSEQGDVKGKEVEFDTLFQLNKHIDLSSAMPNNHPTNSNATAANNNNHQPRSKMPPPAPPTSSHRSTRIAAMAASSRASTSSNNTTQYINNSLLNGAAATSNGNLHKQPSVSSKKGSLRLRPSNARQTVVNNGTVTGYETQQSSASNLTTTGVSRISTLAQQQQQLKQQQSAEAVANRRKSNAVKEVGKIAKQREERRAKQEAQKLEKIELMSNVEPGTPNWEFLGMIKEYREQLTYKPITANDEVVDHTICVAVRKRPINKREASRKDVDVVTVPSRDLTIVHEPKQKVDLTRYLENHIFRFDYAFDETATNELVYKYTARPLVQTVFDGGMATCFAYGQTGSGKTHTMGGDFNGKTQDSTKGIYALVARDVFKMLRSPKYRGENLVVHASFFEIYSGKVFDLLNDKAKLRVLEDAQQQVRVVGLREELVESVEDVLNLINTGNNIRTSGQTSANNHSSRSHAVFQIILKHNNRQQTVKGKFSLIDLAGNERGADTSSANRQTRMEGAEINKSLLALKECIRALGRRGAHLPFRASKLTQVLRDSFIGENSRTCMIAMISPGMQSCEHSLNTLRYADRVKELGTEGPELKSDENGENDAMSPEDDLALLHNSNSAEISQDMHTFHEAISHLQDMEDEISDIHKNLVEHDNIVWHNRCKELLNMANEVDYDVDQYAQQLDELLSEKLEGLASLKEKVVNFRAQLREEELMSKKMVK